jgi:hypothetical protein
VIFFESKDCSSKNAPLSSFKIRQKDAAGNTCSPTPYWEGDLLRAVMEAKSKLSTASVPKKPVVRKSRSGKIFNNGVREVGGHRMERHHLESCLW